jgi:hypothetical protein
MRNPRVVRMLALVGGVLALGGCGPSINKAAKADIDYRIGAMVPSDAVFPMPAAPGPKPLAKGQWTLYKVTSEKGQPWLLTYKIVSDDEGGAFWVEVANESYYGKTVNKLLLAMGDRSNPATMEIRAVKMKDKQGKVTELDAPTLARMRPLFAPSMSMLAVSWQGLPQESVNVVAGNFTSCFKAMTDASWGVWRAMATSWMHPTVPISGLVKSVVIGRSMTIELVGFGDGATSEIP